MCPMKYISERFSPRMAVVLFITRLLVAEPSPSLLVEEPKISVQNCILARVNGNTISVMDVMKKMDVNLHQHYPQYADSPHARYQFYTTHWQNVLRDMIDAELILSDAAEKEVKVSEGDIHEELERRFGPDIMTTLDSLKISYEEAWKMVKSDLTLQRMTWFFVHSKAAHSVTPQAIREGYRQYLASHPPFQELTYRVITVRTEETDAVRSLHSLLTPKSSEEAMLSSIQEWEKSHPGSSAQVSTEYTAKDQELSEAYREALHSLAEETFSQPVCQQSRITNQMVYRIFYLARKTDHFAPPFDELSDQIKKQLTQDATVAESDHYLQKLRKRFGFETLGSSTDSFQPFRIESFPQ